jgi:hypothetical protein
MLKLVSLDPKTGHRDALFVNQVELGWINWSEMGM